MDKKKVIFATFVEHSFNRLKNITIELSDSEDEENDEEILIMNWIANSKQKPKRIEGYVRNVVAAYNRVEFQQNFRMTREVFEIILEKFSNEYENKTRILIEKQLLAFIWLLATPDSYRSVGERFNIAKSTLSLIFFRVIEFLKGISGKIIKFPNRQEKTVTKNYCDFRYKLKGVVGCVDGAYIPMKAPASQRLAYTNRKFFTSVTLQAICDTELKFLDCFIGYPSSVHDSRIFRNSPFYKKVTENREEMLDEGEKILGDKAYPVENWIIPPFIDRGHLTPMQKHFNKQHASCRSAVERSFALLFGRFRRLRYVDMNCCEFVPAVILAACVLHNLCLADDTDVNLYIDEGMDHYRRNIPTDTETIPGIEPATRCGIEERNSMCQSAWQRR